MSSSDASADPEHSEAHEETSAGETPPEHHKVPEETSSAGTDRSSSFWSKAIALLKDERVQAGIGVAVAAAVVVTRTAAKVRSERTGAPGRAERVRHLPEQPESSRSPSQQVAAARIRAQAGWEIVEVIVVGSFSFNFNFTPSPIPVARNVPTAYFAAARNGVARDCIAKGPMIFLNAEDTASEGGIVQSPAHWQAFTQFSDQLSAQGWELIDSWGKFWYSARFQRPISFK